MKRRILIGLLALLMLMGCGAKKDESVVAAENLIRSIGDVTLEKEPLVKYAETYYNTLSEKQKRSVTNYEDLVSARIKIAEEKAAQVMKQAEEKAGKEKPAATPAPVEETPAPVEKTPEPAETPNPAEKAKEAQGEETPLPAAATDKERKIYYYNLCWTALDNDSEPDWDIYDDTHLVLCYPGWPDFSSLNVYVCNRSKPGSDYVLISQQDDVAMYWERDTVVVYVTDKAEPGHYAIQIAEEPGWYALVFDFLYAKVGDVIPSDPPGWSEFKLGLLDDTEPRYLAVSGDRVLLSRDKTHYTSFTGRMFSVDDYYFYVSDGVLTPTRNRFIADNTVVEMEFLMREDGNAEVYYIRCGDAYFAVDENGEVVLTEDRQQAAQWVYRFDYD